MASYFVWAGAVEVFGASRGAAAVRAARARISAFCIFDWWAVVY